MSCRGPVVFACAGCSPAGRLAYDLAQELDRREEAEMSCLAGLAGELPYFTRKVEGRPLWIIDGCPLECCAAVLQRLDRRADVHIRLHRLGVRKHAPASDPDLIPQLLERAGLAASPSPACDPEGV